jgi:hypothetical protein
VAKAEEEEEEEREERERERGLIDNRSEAIGCVGLF